MMINYQGEEFTETEFYGREILEAIQLTNKFPISKKKLTSSLEKMIHEQFDSTVCVSRSCVGSSTSTRPLRAIRSAA
ncbi:hypothetical protein [Streptomyces sp. NPDC051776]|uniref:hypothetical protein n=1 Tax=Streptomyces sp. NPDC051776 TaxID=3155414 RepID=UPI003414E7BF